MQTAKQQAAAALAEHEAQQPESPSARRRALQEVQEQARLAEAALTSLRQQQLAVQERLQQVGAAGAASAKANYKSVRFSCSRWGLDVCCWTACCRPRALAFNHRR